jgi:hypothetical protein
VSTEVHLTIFSAFVNQLTDDDDDLTSGYSQQDGTRCHISSAGMGEIEDIFGNQVISKAIILRGTPD